MGGAGSILGGIGSLLGGVGAMQGGQAPQASPQQNFLAMAQGNLVMSEQQLANLLYDSFKNFGLPVQESVANYYKGFMPLMPSQSDIMGLINQIGNPNIDPAIVSQANAGLSSRLASEKQQGLQQLQGSGIPLNESGPAASFLQGLSQSGLQQQQQLQQGLAQYQNEYARQAEQNKLGAVLGLLGGVSGAGAQFSPYGGQAAGILSGIGSQLGAQSGQYAQQSPYAGLGQLAYGLKGLFSPSAAPQQNAYSQGFSNFGLGPYTSDMIFADPSQSAFDSGFGQIYDPMSSGSYTGSFLGY